MKPLLVYGSSLALMALVLPGLLSTSPEAQTRVEERDTCVECHSNPKFLVTNKKLYDYYQQWTSSVHRQEDVSCVDCHGGDSATSNKNEAHGGAVAEATEVSGVNFRNIPDTCGGCHEGILEGFRKSAHFEHVAAKEQEAQGPTCVTCHGSINVGILNVNSVEEACTRCHNRESDNHPENPAKARLILNEFLSIHRFYRYITIRTEPEEGKAFFEDVDLKLRRLSVTWHTFDLPKIEEELEEVLALLKAKRDEVRRRRAEQK
jgi:formate-dependent nitrite reductase cytochrome c552 subunit